MKKKFLLYMSITCDEYIPEFLNGMLNHHFIYDNLEEAKKESKSLMDKFTQWLQNDTSCSIPAQFEIIDNCYEGRILTCKCGEDFQFKITIVDATYVKESICEKYIVSVVDEDQDGQCDGKARILSICDTEEEARSFIENDMKDFIDQHTQDDGSCDYVINFDKMECHTQDYLNTSNWNFEKKMISV